MATFYVLSGTRYAIEADNFEQAQAAWEGYCGNGEYPEGAEVREVEGDSVWEEAK